MENNFNFIRLIAAWLVLFGHSFQFLGIPEPHFMSFLPLGPLGVCIFFTISGFLVTKSWESDPHLLRFFMRRSLRIFPGLIVCILLTIFVLGPVISSLPAAEYFSHPNTLFYLNNIILYPIYSLPGVFEHNTIPHAVNGSLWSLPVEFMAYVALAATAFVFRSKWAYVALAILVCALAYFWAGKRTEMFVFYGSDLRQLCFYGTFFAIGSVIAAFNLQRHFTITLVTLAIVLIICMERFTAELIIMMRFLLPIAVIGFGIASSPLISKLTSSGDYSYGIYIYAFPVQQTIVHLYPDIGISNYILICTVVTLLLSIASWHLIEQHALRLKPRKRHNTKEPTNSHQVSNSENQRSMAIAE